MYLSRLEINGFKSFAKKTTFEFGATSNHDAKAQSITAVVGPNGSGKSNVSDAIRWVLGEQSLKLIRCKKADDVIFGGSESKARQGVAEVALTMNNEDRELPIDYSEVVLTRRVYRDGETEYLINKSKVRLFDILMLLAKANFGQRSYSIIGQGMVDHIINVTPHERKEFFDEATGVKQYQIKRDQAVNKLARSRENLLQSNQILQELEPRLRLLTKQVKKLEQRKEIETQLRSLQEQYYTYIWQRLDKERREAEEKFGVEDAVRQDLENSLREVQVKLAELAREESRKDLFNNLQKDFSKLQTEKNDILRELATIKGKMNLEYAKAGKQNLSWLENKKEEIVIRLNEIAESFANLQNKVEFQKTALLENEEKMKQTQDEMAVLSNNAQTAESDLRAIQSGGRLNGSLESARALLRQREVLKGIHGLVSDVGLVEKMYETALATAASGKLSALVVETDETAVRCIDYLKQNHLPPVTFFPLNKIRSYPINKQAQAELAAHGAIAFAVDLVATQDKFKKVFEQIFGGTIVFDNLNSAKQFGVGRERMVTLEGDLLEKSGVMKGGYRRQGSVEWSSGLDKRLATQEEKMREVAILRSKLTDKQRQKDELQGQITDLKVELQVNDTHIKGLAADLDNLKKEKQQIDDELEENKISPDQEEEFLKKLGIKKKEYERQSEALDVSILEIRKKIDNFNLEEERKKATVFRLQTEMQEVQGRLNEASNRANEVKISLARLEAKKEDLEKEALRELEPEFDWRNKAEVALLNTEALRFDISKFKNSLEQIGGIDTEVVTEHQEVSERYEFLSNQVQDLEKAIIDLDKVVTELDAVIVKQFDVSFHKINKAFQKYFEKIFNGGKAKLELLSTLPSLSTETLVSDSVDAAASEDALALSAQDVNHASKVSGIEIMVAPPNKKINNISILSGGERTMTSLALICAIIETNPAPFIVMDEVDAALDEANSEKLSIILQELSYHSQFVVITHNRVIMHVADVLYGVAMGDDGVSRTLSLSLKELVEKVEN